MKSPSPALAPLLAALALLAMFTGLGTSWGYSLGECLAAWASFVGAGLLMVSVAYALDAMEHHEPEALPGEEMSLQEIDIQEIRASKELTGRQKQVVLAMVDIEYEIQPTDRVDPLYHRGEDVLEDAPEKVQEQPTQRDTDTARRLARIKARLERERREARDNGPGFEINMN